VTPPNDEITTRVFSFHLQNQARSLHSNAHIFTIPICTILRTVQNRDILKMSTI